MGLLQLRLARIPKVVGIYGATKDQFPTRMAYLHPDAAKAFADADKALGLVVSDMFRSAEESLRARAEKSGVQAPGYSAHNYGLAIDVAVDAVLKKNSLTKPALDSRMENFGWYCHRSDGRRGFEDWHYNYLGKNPGKYVSTLGTRTRDTAVAAFIADLFGDDLKLTAEEAQIGLSKMKLYRGDIDGVWGGGSKQALMAFQRAWELPATGTLDAKTERTLAYVTAEVSEAKPCV